MKGFGENVQFLFVYYQFSLVRVTFMSVLFMKKPACRAKIRLFFVSAIEYLSTFLSRTGEQAGGLPDVK